MIDSLSPALILIVGALLVPLLRGKVQRIYLLTLPLLSFAHLLGMESGLYGQIQLFDYALTLTRIDKLSLVWGYIFHIVAFISVIFSLHVKDNTQHVSGLIYAGAALGAVFAGDLITLFVFWELTAISSVFLIWSRRTQRAYKAGLRYLIVLVGSGMILFAGVLIHIYETGSIAFDYLGLNGLGTLLIFVAFGIKCAFPLLHNWLQDAYPEATVTGTVFLSAFTTKVAVYALARAFPGTEILVPIGAVMTVFPIFYAVIENDLRRVLAYSLNNQLGFMVVGIGLGTAMSLNGTAAHAFTHILYKALLFMSMGAVLYRTGTIKGSELGGLYKSMPLTMVFCIVGAASISGFPLFSGFVSKSLILSAAADGYYTLTWFALLFASAGMLIPDLKIPFFAFFAHDSGIRCKEAPPNMLIAMGATATLSVLIGVFPDLLYAILPYPVDYEPYTVSHVMEQLQLLFFSALAFTFLKLSGIYPPELRSVNLDSDWLYRRLLPNAVRTFVRVGEPVRDGFFALNKGFFTSFISGVYRLHASRGIFARTWLTSTSVQVILLLLAAYLLFYILQLIW